MRVVTADTMRALDRYAIEQAGIPGIVLMENAGRAVFDAVRDRFGAVTGSTFAVYCGTGNNGGDGFVVARLLKLAGADVQLWIAGDPARIQGDALTQFKLLRPLEIGPRPGPLRGDVQVDALLGTGSHGAPRGAHEQAIRWIDAGPGPVVAVDIPSGVDSDTGAMAGEAVRADLTVTFGYPKLGLLLDPGASRTGELLVRDIGFPWDAAPCETPYWWIQPQWVGKRLPARRRDAHKGEFGHVLVVGGSRGMSGAPTMTARAALRAGVGLVTVAAPASAQPIIAGKIDEAMTRALPEEQGAVCEASWDALVPALDAADTVALGPGIGRSDAITDFILKVAGEVPKPLVLDADGLYALAESCSEQLRGLAFPQWVLTPHPGECARLLGVTTADVQGDRLAAVQSAAETYGCVVVLKGASTLVADGRRDQPLIAINTTGNPGMATGGSGDTLTGIIGALLAQRLDAYEAACAGVYLHGLAGDLAAERVGTTGLIAGDITDHLPEAIRRVRNGEGD